MKIITTALAALLFTALISCNKSSKENSASKQSKSELTMMERPSADYKGFNTGEGGLSDTTTLPAPPPGEPEKKKQPSGIQEPVPNPDWDKKIIKTADLNIEVKDYNVFYGSLREKIRSVGGWVAQEEQQQSDYKIENTITIRVPVDQFDNALAQLTTNVVKINQKKISSQDVTAEYVDTRSRIEAKKQVRLRYMDLLKQAKNMEEILNVQSEINGIQEEIESATGRVEYLGHASAYSTINLTYYQVLNATAKDTENPTFGTKLNSAFRSGWSWIGELFVGIVSIWPLLLLVFFGVIMYKRWSYKRMKKSPETTAGTANS